MIDRLHLSALSQLTHLEVRRACSLPQPTDVEAVAWERAGKRLGAVVQENARRVGALAFVEIDLCAGPRFSW